MSFLFFIFGCMFSPSPTPSPHTQNLSEIIKCQKIDLNWIDMPQIIFFGSGLVTMFWFILIHLVNQVNFITFNTNLSVYKKNKNLTLNLTPMWFFLLLFLQGLLLSEYPENFSIQWYMYFCPNFLSLTKIHWNFSKNLARGFFHISCLLIFTDSISPATLQLSIFVFQIWCHAKMVTIPTHLPGKWYWT